MTPPRALGTRPIAPRARRTTARYSVASALESRPAETAERRPREIAEASAAGRALTDCGGGGLGAASAPPFGKSAAKTDATRTRRIRTPTQESTRFPRWEAALTNSRP